MSRLNCLHWSHFHLAISAGGNPLFHYGTSSVIFLLYLLAQTGWKKEQNILQTQKRQVLLALYVQ